MSHELQLVIRTKHVNTPVPSRDELDKQFKLMLSQLKEKKPKAPKAVKLKERNAPMRDIHGNLCGPYVGKKRKRNETATPQLSTGSSMVPVANTHKQSDDCPVDAATVGQDYMPNHEVGNSIPLNPIEPALPVPHQQENDLQNLLQLIEEVKTLGLITTEEKKPFVPHAERKQRAEEDWLSLRPVLLAAILSERGDFFSSEVHCFKCDAVALVSCLDCKSSFCDDCDIQVHEIVCTAWHRRFTKLHGYKQPLNPHEVIGKNGNDGFEKKLVHNRFVDCRTPNICLHCEQPDSFRKETLYMCAYITTKGRSNMYIPKFVCNSCGSESKICISDLVVNDLWPGSSNIISGMYIFEGDVLRFFHFLKMESPSLSRRSYLATLEQFSRLHGNMEVISPQPFKTAYNEWQYCQFALEKVSGADWMDCPACSEGVHAVHLDGNKKLYRFKGQNQTSTKNHFGDVFIVKDEEVDVFVKNVKNVGLQGTDTCGETHWKAARSSSKQHKALAETGLEIAVCRHAHILKALNMFQGEIYAYPMYLHQHLDMNGHVDFVCQDIICKYWPYLQRIAAQLPDENPIKTLAERTRAFLSVFHATAHDWTCQVIWGGRWQVDSGAQAGEEAEQANSYLSRASFTTKTMDKAGREEQITAHALYWNRKKISGLHRFLANRYKKCFSKIDKLQKELSDVLTKSDVRGEPKFDEWKAEVQEFAKAVKSNRSERRHANSSDRSALSSMKIEIEVYCSNIKQQKYDISKCADSSKKRGHLRQKMEKEKKKLVSVIELYNFKSASEVIKIDDVIKEDYIFPWELSSDNSAVSYSLKKKLVDINEHINRNEEEKLILIREMKAATNFFKHRVIILNDWLKLAKTSPKHFAEKLQATEIQECTYNLETINERVVCGVVCEMKGTLEFYRDLLEDSAKIFEFVTNDQDFMDTFDFLFGEETDEVQYYEEEDYESDDVDDDECCD